VRGLVIAISFETSYSPTKCFEDMETDGFDRSVQDWTPAQPHFDDELTVLSARPVVPLKKINARLRHRRRWLLSGAFVLAMMLGAGSALLASYLRLRNTPAPAPEISQEESTPEPLAVAESVPSESPVEESLAEPSPVTSDEHEQKKAAPAKRRTIARSTPDLDLPRNDSNVNEEQDLNRIREAVLYDQWQERRARRVARRERRRLDRYNHRDLSNLDEIFEGRKKP
jgi:hypothetical protein